MQGRPNLHMNQMKGANSSNKFSYLNIWPECIIEGVTTFGNIPRAVIHLKTRNMEKLQITRFVALIKIFHFSYLQILPISHTEGVTKLWNFAHALFSSKYWNRTKILRWNFPQNDELDTISWSIHWFLSKFRWIWW